ncbi:hypothetical protein GCM10010504_07470 [Streptomyces griseus]|nr:hypothetical protein GCM10010504_07470 [Streptomyces griseus]
MCREDGDLSFVAAQLSADGLWAWPLLSAFTRMALEWVGRGGFVHVSECTENVCGPGRAAYRGSLPRVRRGEIRRCVNYSVVANRSGTAARGAHAPVGAGTRGAPTGSGYPFCGATRQPSLCR